MSEQVYANGIAVSSSALAKALVNSMSSARIDAIEGFVDEMRIRSRFMLENTEQSNFEQSCKNLLQFLQEQGTRQTNKFEILVIDYLFKVPHEHYGEGLRVRPAELIAPLAALKLADEEDGDGCALCEEELVAAVVVKECVEHTVCGRDDMEIADAYNAVGNAIRQGCRLREETHLLHERLCLLRSMVEVMKSSSSSSSNNCHSTPPGRKEDTVACRLQDLMAKLGNGHTALPSAPAAPVAGNCPKRPHNGPQHRSEAASPSPSLSESPKRLRAASAAAARAASGAHGRLL
mmetsp:Transcript_12873/g.34891  ORF Transcript_12873/g.34891 Transcript_12873/m.34891 type:complete len:291 (-) Transcript_12873:193-1065(-)|eukprot:CAMPEP_0177347718 /NCGR_PEP_ID=MMETSP0368-20130122/29877_1 /TAXON_ID=447022 ORGANISM="Scrippsiella hangoei-like, Strain SHHI-4" /NCGR_SAMPLE_ID=MMETSP0368 /ASSEMBLY_ACC=CAM_ASM_000363 /LENGTH=290 /DNA_ID=CAMNT_0018809473 /DNA_START=82 /DNA_END=954 /DNA_ORIENTATION=+